MDEGPLDVSVIIVNYMTPELTIQCIRSIYDKTEGISFEIIVVDNASKDDSVNIIKIIYPTVVVIENAQNIGFGRANNIGVNIAKGRNILFLNSDTYLVNNAIKILSVFLDSYKEIGACGGNLYNEGMQPNFSYSRVFPGIFSLLNILFLQVPQTLRFGKNVFFNNTNKPIQIKSISGADLMVSARILKQVGAFDPNYFMYCEETDLQYRIIKAGYKILCFPEAMIVHLGGASYNYSFVRMTHILTSRRYFILKNYSRVHYYISNIIFAIILFFSLLRNTLQFNLRSIKENIRTFCFFSKMIFPSISSKDLEIHRN